MDSEESQDQGPGGTARPDRPSGSRGPRTFNLAAVAGGIVLIGLVAFALYRRGERTTPGAGAPGREEPASAQRESFRAEDAPKRTAPDAAAPRGAAEKEAPPAKGAIIAGVVPVALSPEASIVAERFRCVCGCNDLLSVCTCSKTPGSNDMKRFLQTLVDERKTSAEIDRAMIEKYGEAALASGSSLTPKHPASKRPAVQPKGTFKP